MSEVLMTLQLEEGSTSLKGAQLFPFGTWNHPAGKIKIDAGRAKKFVEGFKRQVAGQRLPVFYIHSSPKNVSNPNYGKAAGWITDMSVHDQKGVMIDIDFTEEGANAVRNKEYQYLSAEYFDKVMLPHHDSPKSDVLVGAALVNRPHLKGMSPLLNEETGHMFLIAEDDNLDDPEGGGPVDPILLALAKAAGIELSEDVEELTEEQRSAIEQHLADREKQGKDLDTQVQLLQEKLDALEDPEPKQARKLAEAGFEEEAKLLSEYRGDKLIREFEADLPDGHVLAPSVKEKLRSYALENDAQHLSDAMRIVASGKGTVDLEEHGSSGGGLNDTAPANVGAKIIKLAEEKIKEDKDLSFSDAMLLVSADEPKLWNEYQESMGNGSGAHLEVVS